MHQIEVVTEIVGFLVWIGFKDVEVAGLGALTCFFRAKINQRNSL